MKSTRLFEIVYLLSNRRTATAQELARHFEVSTRTIQRDIDALMQAGIPLYTKRGRGGGIRLVDGYVLDKAVLTEAEQAQMLMAIQGMPIGSEEAERMRSKVRSFFDASDTDWIEVDFSRWGCSGSDNARFTLLKDAIVDQQAIRFGYVDAEGAWSSREAYPLKLAFKSKAWYLQAFCLLKDDYRSFRVNRIIDPRLTGKAFDRSSFDIPPLEDGAASPTNLISLELVFEPRAAARVYDEFDSGCIELADEGRFHVRTLYPEDEYLYRLLLSFGDDISIVEPLHVCEEAQRRRKAAGLSEEI